MPVICTRCKAEIDAAAYCDQCSAPQQILPSERTVIVPDPMEAFRSTPSAPTPSANQWTGEGVGGYAQSDGNPRPSDWDRPKQSSSAPQPTPGAIASGGAPFQTVPSAPPVPSPSPIRFDTPAPSPQARWVSDVPPSVSPPGAPELGGKTILVSSTGSPGIVSPSAMPGSGSQLQLKQHGALTDRVFKIGRDVIVGRFDPDKGPVDVDLSDLGPTDHISRHHARIQLQGSRWIVEDLGSKNGVFVRSPGGVNQRIAGPHSLLTGDEVSFGMVTFVFTSN